MNVMKVLQSIRLGKTLEETHWQSGDGGTLKTIPCDGFDAPVLSVRFVPWRRCPEPMPDQKDTQAGFMQPWRANLPQAAPAAWAGLKTVVLGSWNCPHVSELVEVAGSWEVKPTGAWPQPPGTFGSGSSRSQWHCTRQKANAASPKMALLEFLLPLLGSYQESISKYQYLCLCLWRVLFSVPGMPRSQLAPRHEHFLHCFILLSFSPMPTTPVRKLERTESIRRWKFKITAFRVGQPAEIQLKDSSKSLLCFSLTLLPQLSPFSLLFALSSHYLTLHVHTFLVPLLILCFSCLFLPWSFSSFPWSLQGNNSAHFSNWPFISFLNE